MKVKKMLAMVLVILTIVPSFAFASKKSSNIIVGKTIEVKSIDGGKPIILKRGSIVDNYTVVSKGIIKFKQGGKTYTMKESNLISSTEYYNQMKPSYKLTTHIQTLFSECDLYTANQALSGQIIKDFKEPYGVLYLLSEDSAGPNSLFMQNAINGFTPINGTNNQKIINALKYIIDLNLRYDEDENLHTNQITSMDRGVTKCYGITVLGSKIFDKAGLPYRVAGYFTSKEDPGHIYLEVKANSGKWVELNLVSLGLTKGNVEKEKNLAITVVKNNLEGEKDLSKDYSNGNGATYMFSPEILRGKVVSGSMTLIYKTVTMEEVPAVIPN